MDLSIDFERKLLDLLGYTIIGPDNSNRYKIFDNSKEVGFIQYKKLYFQNKKKGYPALYGYVIHIDSKDIILDNTRKIYDTFLFKNENNTYSYSFDIKRNDNDLDHVEITISDFFEIVIWSKEYGHMSFSINDNGLFLNYKSMTDNYNIEEVIVYRNNNKNLDEYTYQIKYCNKKITSNYTVCEISGVNIGNNMLKIFENTWENDELIFDNEFDTYGNIEELLVKHQMGINSFNHFRYLLNQTLPFNTDIIDTFVSQELIDKYHLSNFISKENNYQLRKK